MSERPGSFSEIQQQGSGTRAEEREQGSLEERPSVLRIGPLGLEDREQGSLEAKNFWFLPQTKCSSSDLSAEALRRRQERSSNHTEGVMVPERSAT